METDSRILTVRNQLIALLLDDGLPVALQEEVADGYAYFYVTEQAAVQTGGYAYRAHSLEDLSLTTLASLVENGVREEEAAKIQTHTSA